MRECCTLSNDEERSQATKHLLLNINDFGLEVLHQAMLAISTSQTREWIGKCKLGGLPWDADLSQLLLREGDTLSGRERTESLNMGDVEILR